MSNVAVFGNITVADLEANRASMTAAARSTSSGGVLYLKMTKAGIWSANGHPVDGELAVDPSSFVRGWIAWEAGEKMGETTAPYNTETPRPDSDFDWSEQVGFDAVDVRTGQRYVYRTNAVGGKNAVGELVRAIWNRDSAELVKAPVAIISLGCDSYRHRQYGTIYTPVFEVERFVAPGDVTAEPVKVEAPEPAPAAPGRKSRRA